MTNSNMISMSYITMGYEAECHNFSDGSVNVIHIEIEPVWRFKRDGDSGSILVMLDFLNEIRVTGKIGRAAERAGVSYRHAWNLIEKWSLFFGAPLVERKQGRGTNLTPFGGKLVWA